MMDGAARALAEITPANVAQLSMRWVKQFDIKDSNIEATPLVIEGTIFMVTDPGHVYALDAKTGAAIWEYKPPVPDALHIEFRVNRGLAVHGATLFFGSLDGYLVAIDANNGKVIWRTLVASPAEGYTMTGRRLSSIIRSWLESPEANSGFGGFSRPTTS